MEQIRTIAKRKPIMLPLELIDYATELGAGNLDAGVICALRYAQEEELHTMGRLEWWVRESTHGDNSD